MAGVYEAYIGKPLQVISSLGIRYTGIFDSIDIAEETLCFHSVYNWGTEDRPARKFIPANKTGLGWVRFKTSGIASLATIENYVEPGQEDEFDDPTLVSVSQHKPGGPASQPPYPPQQQQPYPQQQPYGYEDASGPSHGRPGAPHRKSSINTAMDRVQQSLADLSTQPRGPAAMQEPVQDFDFAQNERFAAQEREDKRRRDSESQVGGEAEEGQSGEASRSPPPPQPKAPSYQKSSFFDGLSSQTGRVNKNEERHRNLDTFGEAGNNMPGHYGRGGGRGGRGGYNRGGGGGGYGRGGGGGRGRGNNAWRGGNGMPQPAA